jgi:hypothetical protein
MSHKDAIGLLFDAADTIRGLIDLTDFCQVEKGSEGKATDNVFSPYALRMSWRQILTQRVMEDILYGHPAKAKL